MKLGNRALSLLHALINETTGNDVVLTPQLQHNITTLEQCVQYSFFSFFTLGWN